MMSSQFSARQPLTSRINFRFLFNSEDVLRRSEYLNVPNFVINNDLKPQLSYNYFRFGKTNGRHTEILLLVMMLTYQPSSASHFASQHQISCESDHHRHSYDVIKIKIFKMVAVDVTNQFSVAVFTARAMLSAVLGVVILSVCPSVRPSIRHTRAL